MKRSTLLVLTITILSSILFSSCGVMFGGSKYNANIKVKDHPNAEIYANGEKIGTGEVSALFKRNQPLKIEVKQDKCQEKTKNFDNTFRTGNFILSAISFGITGIAVDLGTGAAFKPDHKNDPAIEKLSDKNYKFTVDYSECKED
ncbi:hypothetical protein ACFFU1_10090 [Algibacter miyuki]|uniref:PEGA domain-containing protein n=1 Tax=Algibacter miyuki TaxID=1306933 RepID=A0ABV5H031_9FLAO|nr:hypothetical protein [Algibacter miyuki]MDN3667531.1 hypothetical protein [Algibacter miyuki]